MAFINVPHCWILIAPWAGAVVPADTSSYESVRTQTFLSHHSPFFKSLTKRNGAIEEFYPDGTLMAVTRYADGEKHGRALTFYASKKIHTLATYKQGKLEGKYISYHPGGKLSIVGEYSDNKPSGRWAWYANDGTTEISSSQFYNGLYTEWYENGKVKCKGIVSFDRQQGTWEWFNADGSAAKESHIDITTEAFSKDNAGG